MGTGERRLVDSFWDLRDNAYDYPDRWQGLTAETLLQRLAEYVEAAEERGETFDWQRDVQSAVDAQGVGADVVDAVE